MASMRTCFARCHGNSAPQDRVPRRRLSGRPLPDRLIWYGLIQTRAGHTPWGGPIAKEDLIELEGTVTEVLPSTSFRVTLDNGAEVLATIAGKLRRFRIRILEGDRVTVEVSPYDLTRGRITYRHKA